jgi:hypothetical protein
MVLKARSAPSAIGAFNNLRKLCSRVLKGWRKMNLNVSSLFFEMALIFMPGFIWMKIHTRYGAKGEVTQFDMILNTFIFGVLSYAILDFVYWTRGSSLHILDIDVNSTKILDSRIFVEILYAMVIAVLGGVTFLYMETYKSPFENGIAVFSR